MSFSFLVFWSFDFCSLTEQRLLQIKRVRKNCKYVSTAAECPEYVGLYARVWERSWVMGYADLLAAELILACTDL